MWIKLEEWQLQELQRLAASDPERAETILNTVWQGFEGLLQELTVAAIERGTLSAEEGSERLAIPVADVLERVEAFRGSTRDASVVCPVSGRGARVAGGQIAVWEIVREYRKLGSAEQLTQAFPALSVVELGAAMVYARSHPEEVEEQIAEYEELLEKKRAVYPFAR